MACMQQYVHLAVCQNSLCLQEYEKKRLCCICAKNVAARVTFGDICATESPAFWCSRCYDHLHLDSQGTWIEPAHKVFSYFSG